MIVAIFLHLSRILHDNPVSSHICELIDDGEQGGDRRRAGIAVPGCAALRDAPNGATLNSRGVFVGGSAGAPDTTGSNRASHSRNGSTSPLRCRAGGLTLLAADW
jgi:hypothetical protein